MIKTCAGSLLIIEAKAGRKRLVGCREQHAFADCKRLTRVTKNAAGLMQFVRLAAFPVAAQHQPRGVPDSFAAAVSIPCRIRIGLGGQPGTATSTGIMFATRPQLA